jgi:predicted outer membrane repeat protein
MLLAPFGVAAQRPGRAAGPVIYVVPGGAGQRNGADWANALPLLEALDGAASGSELWVAQGVYTPTVGLTRTATFRLKSGVALYGGFAGTETAREQRDPAAHETILSGDLLANDRPGANRQDNVYHVVTGSGIDATAILDGFTISGGNANDESAAEIGGGMLLEQGGPTLRALSFRNNAAVYGGAIYVNAGTLQISDSEFNGNYASFSGGALSATNSTIHIGGTSFDFNSSGVGHGAISSNNSTLEISRTRFYSNRTRYSGGAIFSEGGRLTLSLSQFIFNGAMDHNSSGGAISFSGTPLEINQTVFNTNGAAYLGALDQPSFDTGPVTITNSIFLHTIGFGEIASRGANLRVRNSIFWHGAAEIPAGSDVRNSLIEGGYAGPGNLDADPLFVDPYGPDGLTGTLDDDLRVRPGSPIINAGDNAFWPADALDEDGDGITAEPAPFDLDRRQRLVGANIDLGPFEYQALVVSPPPPGGVYGDAYAHPFAVGPIAPGGTYALAGSAPPGLSLDAATGVLSGTLEAAGVYSATVSYSSTTDLATQTFTITVAPRPLTVSVDPLVRRVGQPDPPLTIRYAGFAPGDDAADLGGTAACASAATIESPPGEYPITCGQGTVSTPNYALDFIPSTLTILPATIYLPLVVR